MPDPLTVWQADLPWIDPHHAAAAFADLSVLALFDSAGPVAASARYAYLCIDPFSVVTGHGGLAHIDGRACHPAPLQTLADALAPFAMAPQPGAMPFRGGAAGYIGYELGASLEAVPCIPPTPDDPPDLFIGLYDLVIGFDRLHRTCRIHATGLPADSHTARKRRAGTRLDWARQRLARPPPPSPPPPALTWRPDWDHAGYTARVRRVLDHIGAGDIYQANLTMRQQAARPPALSGWAVHDALRRHNPAPFSAWLRAAGHDLCCSSPERFIRLDADGAIEACPIKGTIARDADPALDQLARQALAASAKDRAENVMIVDVLRNDLGRVAQGGSVAVPTLCALHSYATVHHLVSRITARLRPGLNALDLLRAALPGGSITGAPKIRAMQIIAALEAGRRGPYCGCVAWIGWDGAMDSNIVIRSLVLTPQRVLAQAGGGIVADSDPAAEYQEMMLKSAPMRAIFPAMP